MKIFTLLLLSSFSLLLANTTAPSQGNKYVCGVFDNVLTTYDTIVSSGNYDKAIYTANIAYPPNKLTGNFQCIDGGVTAECLRNDPPENKLDYKIYSSSKLGTDEATPSAALTDLEYGDFHGNFNLTLNPSVQNSLGKNVMLLGDVTLTGADSLTLASGDYYLNSLTFTKNNPSIVLSDSGPVRIFIKKDFNVTQNGLNINRDGKSSDLFVYIKGDMDFQTNGNVEKIKGFFYVKGAVKLNANSNNFEVHGGITAEGSIDISGNNGDFYQDSDAAGLGYGECQMCYAEPHGSNGMRMAMMSMCTPLTPCNLYVPIRNTSTTPLDNLKVVEVQSSLVNMTWGSHYEVLDKNGNVVPGSSASKDNGNYSDLPMGFSLGIKTGSITYNAGNNYPTYNPNNDYYEMHKKIDFSMSAFSSNDLIYLSTYTTHGRDYNVKLGLCEESINPSSTYIPGPFDAWDTFRDNANTPPDDRNISTKIVNKAFKLSLASLNKSSNHYEFKTGEGNISVAIYPKNPNTDTISNIPISNTIAFNPSRTKHLSQTPDITVSSASRDAVVGFKLCATYKHERIHSNSIYTLYTASACSASSILNECNATTSTTPTWHICHSTDNFAIRPYAFRVFRENSYARAGEDFNLSIKAVDKTNYDKNSSTSSSVAGVPNYNDSFSNIALSSNFYSPTHSELQAMYRNVVQDQSANDPDTTMKARVATCSTAGLFTKINATDSFVNGNLAAKLKFSETGILTINVDEIAGHEFAIVDADDTNVSQRLILGSTTMKGVSDISQNSLLLVNPYSIDTVAEYNTSTSKSWVYMNDISNAATSFTKPNMSAYLHYTVTAKNRDGAITKNFSSTCFPDITENTPALTTDCPRVNGLKLNTTYDFKLAATINSTANINLSIYNGDKNENALYIDAADQDANLSVGDNNVTKATMYPKQFTDGVAESYVHFNIDRNSSTALNPVTLKVVDANSWLGWSSSASPAAFNGTTLNKSYNFLYGRTHALREKFVDAAVSTNHDAFIYYEVYCHTIDVNGNTCDKNLLPDGITSTSMDSPRWFTNTNHNTAKDGVALHVDEKIDTNTITIGTISGTDKSKFTVNYNGERGYPFTKSMQNSASAWLLYNKYLYPITSNEFVLEFYKANGKYIGSGKSHHSVKIKHSPTLNNNEHRSWW